jgi:hypothetical protein
LKKEGRKLRSFRRTEFPTSTDTPDNSPPSFAKWDSPPPHPGQGLLIYSPKDQWRRIREPEIQLARTSKELVKKRL